MTGGIRFAVEEDLPRLRTFFASVYGPTSLLVDPSHLRWQFQENPWAGGRLQHLIVERDGEIVGHLGRIPVMLAAGERKVSASWLPNLIVSPALRGLGLGVHLVREAERHADVQLVLGYNAQSGPILTGAGWRPMGDIPRSVLLIDAGRALALWLTGQALDDAVRAHVMPTARYATAPDVSCADVRAFGPEWEEAWKRIRPRDAVTVDRTGAYLTWRFLTHPFIRYQVFSVTIAGVLAGLCVLRVEEGDGFRAGRIVDIVGTDAALPALLVEAARRAEAAQASILDVFGGEAVTAAARSLGWGRGDEAPFAGSPILFLPVSTKNTALNLIIKDARGVLPAPAATLAAWHVVKADADKDRAR